MSFLVPKYVCTGCDWTGYGALGIGLRRYRLPSGLYLNINRTTAWCHSCGTLGAAEAIPAVEDTEALIAREEAELAEVMRTGRPGPWWWPNHEYRKRVMCARYSVNEAKGWREFFILRKSPPRCLECGSHQIERLPKHQFRRAHDLIQLPMLHPECSGDGHIVGHFGKNTGASLGTPMFAYEYSIDGELVAKVIDRSPAPKRWR